MITLASRGGASCTLVMLLVLATGARAQLEDEQSSTLDQVRRDQERIGMRLGSLREKMERLAERYRAEGRDRNAVLLVEALGRFDEIDMLERSREIEEGLAASMLSAVERQDQLLTGLESIYSVLRDRRDVDELKSRADLLTEGLGELDRLSIEQRRLLSQSRAAADTPAELLDEALAEVERLERSLEQGASANELLRQTEATLGEAAMAEWLAGQQRALAGSAQPDPARQAVLQQALQELLGRLSSALDAEGATELLAAAQARRERAAEAGQDAAAAMARALGQLAAEADDRPTDDAPGGRPTDAPDGPTQAAPSGPANAEPGSASREEPSPAADATRDQAALGTPPGAGGGQEPDESVAGESDAGATGKPGEPSHDPSAATAGTATESGAADETAADETAAGEHADAPGGSQGSASESQRPSDEPGPSNDSGASSEPGQAAGSQPSTGQARPASPGDGDRSAHASSGAGQQPPESGPSNADPSTEPADTAQSSMEEAARFLEEMRDDLLDAERAATAARNRGAAMAAAAQRQAQSQAEDLNETAQRLESAMPEAGPELLDRTRELMAEVDAAQEAGGQGDRAAAATAMSSASQDLAAIQRMLEQQREGASEARATPRDAAERESAAAEQREVERRLRELMERLSELPDQAYRDPAERAQAAMGEAEQALEGGDDRSAASSQEEAAEDIEEARKTLQGERDRYEQLRQEEVLFRLNEELAAMLDGQLGLTAQTSELGAARGDDGERLTRSQRRAAGRLADEQRGLAERASAAAESLREDGAVAFVFALEQVAEDMTTVADRLADQETGRVVASLQAGVEQRLTDLIAVLDEELERRREAMRDQNQDEQQQQDQPQNTKAPLVPPVAELLLVQRMELLNLTRLMNFRQELGDAPRLSPRDVVQLERWANEHLRVTALFDSLVPRPPEGPGAEVEIDHPETWPEPEDGR